MANVIKMPTNKDSRKAERDQSFALFCSSIALALVVLFQSEFSFGMTLSEYLNRVKSESLQYKSQVEMAEGSELKAREADLTYTPSFFAEGGFGDDSKPTSPQLYDSAKTQSYSLGLNQTFKFGLQAKISYEFLGTQLTNASSQLNPSDYWDASPKIELTLPLWGGGFGRNEQANESLIRSQNLAQKYSSDAQAQTTLSNAESAYWKLATSKEVVRIQEQALKAAQNIYDYLNKKSNMNLSEKSDVVQAQALVEARSLELQIARNEERVALQEFNRFLQREPWSAIDALDRIDYESLKALQVPSFRKGDRADVRALQAQTEAAKANAVLVRERNRPTLDLYGRYALNGRDERMSEAVSEATGTNYDSRYIGLRFKMPLNFSATSDVKSGAAQTMRASEMNEEQALYMQNQDWIFLTQTLGEARDNLKLISKIEATQKTKLDTERVRFRQGRTTTYQVLMFEQDYSQAAINRAKSAAQILALWAQIQLYSGGN